MQTLIFLMMSPQNKCWTHNIRNTLGTHLLLGQPSEQVMDPSAARRLAHILKSQFPSTFTN